MRAALLAAWSRRAALTGAVVLLALGTTAADEAAARRAHHRPKKRCKKLGTACAPTGRSICGTLVCGEAVSVERYCCRAENAACRADADCCDGYGCFGLEGDAPFCKLA